MLGADKIPVLIAEKAQSLIQQLVPTITQIVEKTGIQNIGQPNMVMPSVCLPADDLQNIIQLRNNMVDKLNSVSSAIELLSKPIDTLTPILSATETGLTIGKAVLLGLEAAIIAAPPAVPIPGALINGYVKANDLINVTLPPLITTTSNKIKTITSAVGYVDEILFKILNLLNSIDSYLIGCGVTGSTSQTSSTPQTSLTPTNNYLNAVDKQYTQVQESPTVSQIYNGFTLDIVEEQFSPTVKRIKAVAKNSQGIILLETPRSFTTTPQVLIEELKLIIDKNYTSLPQVNRIPPPPPPTPPPLPPPPPATPPTTTDQPTTTQPQFIIYTTRPGDTFRKIALIYNVNIKLLETTNKNINLIDYLDLSRSFGVRKPIQLKIPKP